MAKWIEARGIDETAEGVHNVLQVFEALGLEKDMTERSRIIAAVHHPFDDFADLMDEDEVREAFASELTDLHVNEFTRAESEQTRAAAERRLTKSADVVLVAAVDAHGLRNTDTFRTDIATAPWRRTGR